MPAAALDTPVGRLRVVEAGGRIARVAWGPAAPKGTSPLLEEAIAQLGAYFAGRLRASTCRWRRRRMRCAPRSARRCATSPMARPAPMARSRALGTYGKPVGQACAANPLPVIVPCHRVLSAEGLGGYSGRGGVETKIALLRHEGGYPFLV